MKRIVFSAASLLLFTALAAQAQTFTSEQQEIIDIVQGCWDSWAQEDYEGWATGCPRHLENSFWNTAEPVPSIGWMAKYGRQHADAFFPIRDVIAYEVRPIQVSVFEDVALYHHWATWTELDVNGVATTYSRKGIDVWQRVDGQWTVIGGMWSPDGG